MRVTAWDRRTALGAAGLTAVSFLVALLLSAATDEGGVAWRERIVRALPVVPLASALATVITLRTLQRRGELVALFGVGIPPWRAAAPVVLGAAVPALVLVVLALASGKADVHAFFPRVSVDGLVWDGERFVDVTRGVQVLHDGALVRVDKSDAPVVADLPRAAVWAVGLSLGGAALALPMHVAGAFPNQRVRGFAIVLAALAPTIVLFQLAAQALVPAMLAVVPVALLLALTPFCYRERP
jgi:hypothetical protein